MIRRVLATPGFYFSYRHDLTNSLQRVQQNCQTKGSMFTTLPLHERADERFLWNGHLLRDLVVMPELRRFIVPIIVGNVSISQCIVNSKTFVFTIISRRSVRRAGKYIVHYVIIPVTCNKRISFAIKHLIFVHSHVIIMSYGMSLVRNKALK